MYLHMYICSVQMNVHRVWINTSHKTHLISLNWLWGRLWISSAGVNVKILEIFSTIKIGDFDSNMYIQQFTYVISHWFSRKSQLIKKSTKTVTIHSIGPWTRSGVSAKTNYLVSKHRRGISLQSADLCSTQCSCSFGTIIIGPSPKCRRTKCWNSSCSVGKYSQIQIRTLLKGLNSVIECVSNKQNGATLTD
jgi:hypothetical protein